MSLFLFLNCSQIHSKTGNGGNAGRQSINVRRVRGRLDLTTCRGTGGLAASNGAGGVGKFSRIRLKFECDISPKSCK